METESSRTEILIGKDGVDKLKKAKVAIFRNRRRWFFCA